VIIPFEEEQYMVQAMGSEMDWYIYSRYWNLAQWYGMPY